MTLKEKIVAEALRQFSTKGFLATSTVDIIQAAGTSKGGLYNHFKSKEQLFYEALSQARKIWREHNLNGVDEIPRPIDKITRILANYRDRYLMDSDNFPGGCIFIHLTVELSDQRPQLAKAVTEGFARFKAMLRRLLDQEREAGTLRAKVDIDTVVEMVFSGLLGACVMYTADKSTENLDRTIGTLIGYLERLQTDFET
jgi:TetR/AcrR family transcriptional regulator, transcriptional repressor for nem operon